MSLFDLVVAPDVTAMRPAAPASPGRLGALAARPVWELAVGGALATYPVQALLLPAIGALNAAFGVWAPPPVQTALATQIVVGILIAPVVETVVFQWAVLAGLRARGPLRGRPVLAACVSALLFAAAHGYSAGYVLFAFATGSIFAAVFQVAGRGVRGTCATWGAHVLRNAVGVAWRPLLLPMLQALT